jgi:hypothetical protein
MLNGGKSDKLMTDSSGFYKFDQLEGSKNYIITYYRKGFVFDPISVQIENLNGNKQQNILGTAIPIIKCTISGYVKDQNSIAMQGVTMTLTGEKQFVVKTDAFGFYKIDSVESGSYYQLMAEKAGYSFNPKYAIFENLKGNVTQNFSGTIVTTHSISGQVKDKDSKSISGVVIELGGEKQMKTIADSNGFYKFDYLESGKFYQLIACKRGYKFDPDFAVVENLIENKIQNFTGYKSADPTFTICGYIEDKDNVRLSGVNVMLSGDSEATTQTDNNGFYKFENLEEGKNYIITPFKQGYNFYPPTINLNNTTDTKMLNSVGTNTFRTGIGENGSNLPNETRLFPNYPNPFNPVTTIWYELKNPGRIKLKVYDMLGREIATLFEGYRNAGTHSLQFDARYFSSGKYIVRLQTDNTVKIISMSLVK